MRLSLKQTPKLSFISFTIIFKGNKNLLEAVRQAVRRLTGAYALAVIAAGEHQRVIAARQGCPLILGKGIGENYLASDILALRAVTDRFIYLEEGDLVDLRPNQIEIWNVNDEICRPIGRESGDGSRRHGAGQLSTLHAKGNVPAAGCDSACAGRSS